jgi:hypothetical protein
MSDIRYRFKSSKPKPDNRKSSKISWESDDSNKISPDKFPDPTNIFSIWDEQRRMEAEEEKMARELSETKRKAKELQKTLRKHKYGEINTATNRNVKKLLIIFIKYCKIIKLKITSFSLLKTKKKFITFAMAIFITIGAIGYFFINSDNNSPVQTLGEISIENNVAEELPRETPKFPILYPNGTSPDQYDLVRINPEGSDTSYTYLDRFTEDGQIFNVTQQKVPDSFDLQKTATNFQATNVIQVDENIIYHGYSERSGVQSIFFIKNQNLVSIRSPQKFSDDQWTAYFLSLN